MGPVDNQALWEVLVEEFESLDYECSIRADYSGRGMYGRRCVGITASNPVAAFADFVLRIMEFDQHELAAFALELLKESCTDSMGLDRILYFPGWEAEDSRDQDEEDDDE